MSDKENDTNFLKFIAYLQIIGIILVVLGHSLHEYPYDKYGNLLVYRMLYSFRMPLFIFVSGFLMLFTTRITKKKRPTIKGFISLKVQRLLLPFIVLTLVTFIPRTMMSGIADDAITLSIESLAKSLLYGNHMVIPYFWFLQASFILLITTYAIITICEYYEIGHHYIYIGLIIAASILLLIPCTPTKLLSLDRVAELGIYFIAGTTYCRYAKQIDKYIPWTSFPFLIFIAAIWGLLFFITENTPFMPVCSFFGIGMCICLAKMLEYNHITVLDHLIGANYIIFLLSWYFNVLSQQILHHYTNLPWWIYSILSLISGIYIPWLAYKYLQSHKKSRWIKLTAFLLGQRLKD